MAALTFAAFVAIVFVIMVHIQVQEERNDEI